MIIASGYCGSGLRTESSTKPQSSAISEHSLLTGTPERIRDWLTSLPPDSPASRSVSLESAGGGQTSATCGRKPSSAFAWFDHDTHCLKMCQDYLIADIFQPSSVIFPKAGTMQNGVLYRQPRLERRISGIVSGLLPKPTGRDRRSGKASEETMSRNARPLNEVVKHYPTPVASGKLNGGTRDFQRLQELADAGQISEDERRSMSAGNGGELNPGFVEWLMGFPQGWTALEPLDRETMEEWMASQPVQWQEETVPRLEEKVPHRVNRLKGLGNGQVPAVVATVWRLLMEGR
jgi:hypothetical protein